MNGASIMLQYASRRFDWQVLGNPIEIMELGYALQLLSLEAVMKDKTLSPGIQPLPDAVNDAACVMCLGFDPKK